jgi:hypothetical protein
MPADRATVRHKAKKLFGKHKTFGCKPPDNTVEGRDGPAPGAVPVNSDQVYTVQVFCTSAAIDFDFEIVFV